MAHEAKYLFFDANVIRFCHRMPQIYGIAYTASNHKKGYFATNIFQFRHILKICVIPHDTKRGILCQKGTPVGGGVLLISTGKIGFHAYGKISQNEAKYPK